MMHQDPSDSVHYADKSRRTSRIFRTVRAWYFFPLHLILVIAFAVIALAYLNGQTFPSSSDAPFGTTIVHIFKGELRQADVTTLISAALVLVRLTLNVCSSIAAQRSIFILLEKCGITLQEIERIFSFEQGPVGLNGFKLGTIVLLLLLIPAQLSAPLAQGAVSWVPELRLRHADYNVTLNVAGPTLAFTEFQEHIEPRDFSIKRASGLAVIHRHGPDFYTVENSTKKVPSRRWAPAFREHELSNHTKGYQALLTNTTIGNTTLPMFHMSNLTWIDYDPSFEQFLDEHNGLFNVTGPMNPIRASLPGNAIILRNRTMDSWLSAWPNATRLNNTTFKIAVLTENLGENATATCSGRKSSSIFGALPQTKPYSAKGPTNYTNCYLFAETTISAGTTQCHDCSIISPGVVERPGNATASFDLSPDPLLPIIMGMLPETMLSIVTGNATYAPTWSNLDGFVAGAFAAAYQASWNDLTDRLAQPQQQTSTNISLPSYPLRADIDPTRVRTWLAFHLLVVVSGAILAVMQARCSLPPVVDFAAACLLTDPSAVVRAADAADVRTAARVDGKSSSRVGKLVMREEGGGTLRFRVLKRKRDDVFGSGGGSEDGFGGWVGGGAGGDGIRGRRAARKRESWSDLSLLSSRSNTIYEQVLPGEERSGIISGGQPLLYTPHTGSSWQSSPGYVPPR
ncbi:hypothetical protein BFW01_g5592 [Lasiodiplodia theobromae]|nr:hypothetical protein BFW01_g5592 [Lasiodiplodia theobromae]